MRDLKLYQTYQAIKHKNKLFYSPSLDKVFWSANKSKAKKKFKGHNEITFPPVLKALKFLFFKTTAKNRNKK